MRRALASKLLFPPGQGYEYANAGYSLLAAVVEQVDRQGLRDGPRRARAEAGRHDGDRLQGPALGRGARRPRLPRRRGLGHDPRPHRGARARRSGRCGATAACTRRSPTWCAGTRRCGTDAVLTAASRESYFRPRVAEGPGARSHYAFGWAVEKTPHGTLVQHNGGNGDLRGRAAAVRGRGRDDLPRLDRRGAEGDAGRAGPHRDRLRRAVRPAAGHRHALPRGPARPCGTVPRGVGRGGDGPRGRGRARAPGPSPAGCALLAGVPAAERERYERLGARTADIAGRAFKGDPTGIHEALGGRRTSRRSTSRKPS